MLPSMTPKQISTDEKKVNERTLIARYELSNGTLEVYEGYPCYRHIPREPPSKLSPTNAITETE